MTLPWILPKKYCSFSVKYFINYFSNDLSIEVAEKVDVIKPAQIPNELNCTIPYHYKKISKVVSVYLSQLTIETMSKVWLYHDLLMLVDIVIELVQRNEVKECLIWINYQYLPLRFWIRLDRHALWRWRTRNLKKFELVCCYDEFEDRVIEDWLNLLNVFFFVIIWILSMLYRCWFLRNLFWRRWNLRFLFFNVWKVRFKANQFKTNRCLHQCVFDKLINHDWIECVIIFIIYR